MRGSSSELLLDASNSQQSNGQQSKYESIKEQEQRRRKLLELGFGASRRRPPRRTCRQRFNFYATSALALVVTSGVAALLFLVPLYVDPAISTLAADFSPEPVLCTTIRREDIAGIFNCTWSSCREGCTSDVYRCTHIYVTYAPESNLTEYEGRNETRYGDVTSILTGTTFPVSASSGDVEAVLMVNIKGCGYPPIVDCENFTRQLGYEGARFPCHYSRVNGSIVMANYNREAQVETIMHFLAAPFVVTLATGVALCVMHCDCRCASPPGHHSRGMRRHRMNDLRAFRRQEANSVTIPVEKQHETVYAAQSDGKEAANVPYRQAIDSLMYLSIATRLDISAECSEKNPQVYQGDHSISNRVDRRGHPVRCECGDVTRPL